MRVFVRDRLKAEIGVELLKLVDEVALFAVFFSGEVGEILGLVHVVCDVRLLDGGELEFLPQLGHSLLRHEAHRELSADGIAQRPNSIAQAAFAQRQQIVVLAA